MEQLVVAGQRWTVRRAGRDDVPAIVALLREDAIGAGRETAELATYEAAFEEVDADLHQFLAVVCATDGTVVGTLQLTLVPGLSRGGTKRLLIEGVRLASGVRGAGLGTAHRHERCRQHHQHRADSHGIGRPHEGHLPAHACALASRASRAAITCAARLARIRISTIPA